jgi:hypothetical protein
MTETPPLIVVAYAAEPGPGGADAQLNARLFRALAERWRAPVTMVTAADGPLEADGQPVIAPSTCRVRALGECGELGERPPLRSRAASWVLRLLRAGGVASAPARIANRLTFQLTGQSVKHAWTIAAARVIRRELMQQPDAVVYSRALPFASIDAVAAIRRRHSFRWLVNINDPLPPDLLPGQYTVDPHTNRCIDAGIRRAVPLVSGFTFPCERLRQLQIEKYPEMARVPNAVVPHLPPVVVDERLADATSRCLKMAFLGTLRTNRVRPEFFRALRDFTAAGTRAAIRLSFFVPVCNARLRQMVEGLEHIVDIHENEPSAAIGRAAREADVLLDLESQSDEPLLLAKLASYVAYGKPIWAICERGGTTWELAAKYDWGYASPLRDPSAILQTLHAIHLAWRDHTLASRSPRPALIQYFSPEQVMARLGDLCLQTSR